MYITLDAILWFSLLKFNYITKGFSNVCLEGFLKVLTVFSILEKLLKNCFQKFFRTHISQTLTRYFKNNLRNNS